MIQRRMLYLAPFLLLVLHNDFWWWNDSFLFLGVPIGLSYHLLFCLAVTVVMALMVRNAWAPESESDFEKGGERDPGDGR